MRISDWSSDVCSSDLTGPVEEAEVAPLGHEPLVHGVHGDDVVLERAVPAVGLHRREADQEHLRAPRPGQVDQRTDLVLPGDEGLWRARGDGGAGGVDVAERKSTRLNSSQ